MENKNRNTLPDIRHTFVFHAPIGKVWNAVATSEGLAAWFMPNDFQPVAGHEFYLDSGPYGKNLCRVTEIDPPNRLSFRWAKNWTVTFELKDLDGKTELTLIHAGWDAADKATRGNMEQGWAKLGQSLGKYVEG